MLSKGESVILKFANYRSYDRNLKFFYKVLNFVVRNVVRHIPVFFLCSNKNSTYYISSIKENIKIQCSGMITVFVSYIIFLQNTLNFLCLDFLRNPLHSLYTPQPNNHRIHQPYKYTYQSTNSFDKIM